MERIIFYLTKTDSGFFIFILAAVITHYGWRTTTLAISAFFISYALITFARRDMKEHDERDKCQNIGCGKIIEKGRGVKVKGELITEPDVVFCKECYRLKYPANKKYSIFPYFRFFIFSIGILGFYLGYYQIRKALSFLLLPDGAIIMISGLVSGLVSIIVASILISVFETFVDGLIKK